MSAECEQQEEDPAHRRYVSNFFWACGQMKKAKESAAKKEAMVCGPSIEAAMQLEKPLPLEPDALDTLGMLILGLAGFGIVNAYPLINWASLFILISIYINRANNRSWFSHLLLSIVLVMISTGMLYWRMMNGYGFPSK
jgi:hypothetical protein